MADRFERWKNAVARYPETVPGRRAGIAMRASGVCLLMASLSVLGFTVWEGAGSDLYAEQAQDELRAAYDTIATLASPSADTARVPSADTVRDEVRAPLGGAPEPTLVEPSPLVVPPGEPQPAPVAAAPEPLPSVSSLVAGAPIGRLEIPAIGLDLIVVAGTSTEALRGGPGLWEWGVFPGAPGNATLSGHRTTYGGPFRHLDKLQPGDRVVFHAPGLPPAVFEVRGSLVVDPSQVSVTEQGPGVRLTLATCDPVGSAAKRLVVQAELIEGTHLAEALPSDGWMFRS